MKRALPDGLELDDDRDRVDVEAVHDFISNEPGALGIDTSALKASSPSPRMAST